MVAAFPILNNQAVEAALHVHRRLAQVTPTSGAVVPFQPKFFTPAENELITVISDLIIPTDEKSPGAREARVNEFIDLMISESKGDEQAFWRAGLQAVNRKSGRRFGRNFVEASEDQQINLLEAISQNEMNFQNLPDLLGSAQSAERGPSEILISQNKMNPQDLQEYFFGQIKRRTIEGYYTSEIGIHQELEYKGNAVLFEFEGCTHPEHGA